MSYIASACEEIAKYFHSGMLVILHSTTRPGTAGEQVLSMLEGEPLKVARISSVLLGGARRVGNPEYQTSNLPNVVGGITPACITLSALFYGQPPRVDESRRNGETAREHVRRDQHRAGGTNGADVRSHGNQCLGSDRRPSESHLDLCRSIRDRGWEDTARRDSSSVTQTFCQDRTSTGRR